MREKVGTEKTKLKKMLNLIREKSRGHQTLSVWAGRTRRQLDYSQNDG